MVELTGKTSDFLKIGVAAAGKGDLETVDQLLKLRPDWIERVGSHGRTMLWEAAYRGRTEMVAYLIEKGADINACGCHFTPLLVDISAYCAAEYKNRKETAELLLSHGATVDFFTHVFLGNYDEVHACLSDDPSLAIREFPQHVTNLSATALHYAVSRQRIEILDLLLELGADPRPYSYWLIRFAIWQQNVLILRRLFDAGAEPLVAAIPRSGVTNPDIHAVLDEYGIGFDPNKAEGGWPPLVYASRGDRGGDLAQVRKLLAQGADVNVRNHKQQTALHCAAKAGFVEIAEELLKNGAPVDAVDDKGDTPLMTALLSTIKRKDRLQEVMKLLILHGADPHHQNYRGVSALATAKRKRGSEDWLSVLTGV